MRWTRKRKVNIVRSWLKGNIEMVRKILIEHDISVDELREWISRYGSA